jgi:outer membrane protein OmpA-like peptidoglycan-associated protein
MRKRSLALTTLLLVGAIRPVVAQKAVTTELGIFGQYTQLDKELDLSNPLALGGRAAIYFFRNFGLEADVQFGKSDWNDSGTVRSVTYRPFAFRLTYGLPIRERVRLIIGAGYQNNVYDGRVRTGPGFVAGNEYEDAASVLLGLNVCTSERMNIRFDIPVDHNDHPNFNGGIVRLDGKSTSIGFRVGLNYALSGGCYEKPVPPPPPPPAATPPAPQPTPPPAPPPNQAPVATITAPSSGTAATGPISFSGSCRDPEQGDLTSSLRWTSSRDGEIGTGGSFSRRLSVGSHTITLACADQQGLAGTASVTVSVATLLVRLNWVHFNFDRSTLTAAGRDTLSKIMQSIRANADGRIAVEGHADPYGSDEYNQALSERRVRSVMQYLTGGVDAGRISSKGFGEQCLLLDDDHERPRRTRSEHSVNRRVEIWSVGDQGVSATCRPRQ